MLIKKIKIVLINLFLFLLLLIPLELIVRGFFPFYVADSTEIYHYNQETGYGLKPNFKYSKTSDYYQEYVSNNLGTANLDDFSKEDSLFIFTVGDSFTYGCGNGIDESYPFLLQLFLQQESMGTGNENLLNVVNLGVNGYGGKQNLKRIEEYVKKIQKPKWVFYLGCDNDYQDDALFDIGYKHKHLVEGNPYWGNFYKPIKFLFQDLHIGRYLKNGVSSIRRKKVLATNKVGEVTVATKEEEVLSSLMRYCKENNINLIMSWVVEGSNSKSYEWLKEWAFKNQVSFADWLPKVKHEILENPNLTINNSYSAGHYRTWVNHLIAKSYLEEMKK